MYTCGKKGYTAEDKDSYPHDCHDYNAPNRHDCRADFKLYFIAVGSKHIFILMNALQR